MKSLGKGDRVVADVLAAAGNEHTRFYSAVTEQETFPAVGQQLAVFYPYVATVLSALVQEKTPASSVTIFVDEHGGFREEQESQAAALVRRFLKVEWQAPVSVSVKFLESKMSRGIQLADFVAKAGRNASAEMLAKNGVTILPNLNTSPA